MVTPQRFSLDAPYKICGTWSVGSAPFSASGMFVVQDGQVYELRGKLASAAMSQEDYECLVKQQQVVAWEDPFETSGALEVWVLRGRFRDRVHALVESLFVHVDARFFGEDLHLVVDQPGAWYARDVASEFCFHAAVGFTESGEFADALVLATTSWLMTPGSGAHHDADTLGIYLAALDNVGRGYRADEMVRLVREGRDGRPYVANSGHLIVQYAQVVRARYSIASRPADSASTASRGSSVATTRACSSCGFPLVVDEFMPRAPVPVYCNARCWPKREQEARFGYVVDRTPSAILTKRAEAGPGRLERQR